tara:strand:- start:125 stop:310 length:186 start_codon:yes stop_codon:yes gene_type:complete
VGSTLGSTLEDVCIAASSFQPVPMQVPVPVPVPVPVLVLPLYDVGTAEVYSHLEVSYGQVD